MATAAAFWVTEPGRGEIRPVTLPEPGPDDVLVRTLRTGGQPRHRDPGVRGPGAGEPVRRDAGALPGGRFPGPVKYGYLNVGVVERGPDGLVGRTVFCLYPHQTAYVVPASAVTVVPDGVPAARAVLAGTVETAVNALWDARPLVGDRVAVVGAGMVGCCVARLLALMPGVTVTLVDVDASRSSVAAALGAGFALPADAPGRPGPRRAHLRDVRRPADLAGPAGAGRRGASSSAGTATRRSPSRSAAPSTRAGWRSGPARSARSRRRGGADVRTRSGSPWRSTCCATRRSTCC